MRPGPAYGAWLILAALLVTAVAAPAAAQKVRPWHEFDEDLEPPPPLPEGLRGTVRPTPDAAAPGRINTIRDVFAALQACWRPPAGSGFSGQEVTVRLSFKRNGELLGEPRIGFYKQGAQPEQREPFIRAVRETFERCLPLPFSESLGGAIAGRIFAIRFVDSRSM